MQGEAKDYSFGSQGDDVKMEEPNHHHKVQPSQQSQHQSQQQPQSTLFNSLLSRINSGGGGSASCGSSAQQGVGVGRVLQIDNLPVSLRLEQMAQLFALYGSIKNFKVQHGYQHRHSRLLFG